MQLGMTLVGSFFSRDSRLRVLSLHGKGASCQAQHGKPEDDVFAKDVHKFLAMAVRLKSGFGKRTTFHHVPKV